MYIPIKDRKYWLEIEGEGIPVLLFHGFTGTTNTWSEIVPYLNESHKVIRMDLPGHGKTVTNGVISMLQFCDDLAIILEKLKLEKTHLLGYSLGGRTALSFACVYPEKVLSLVIESGTAGLKEEQDRKLRQEADLASAKEILDDGIPAFVNKWERLPLFETQAQLPNDIQKKIKEERLSQTSTGLSLSLTGMGTGFMPNWWTHLEKLPIPTLILVGDLDLKFVKIGKEMHKLFPNSEFQIISDSGHAINLIGTIVSEFISKQEGG